jgi:Fur family ferric uptake transcriptional regulator
MSEEETINKAWQEFVEFIKSKGDRVTRARQIIFEHVMRRHDHFRADDVALKLSGGQERVSRGTVYRTLALMEESGFVRAFSDGDTHRHYEHVYGHKHHEHFICEKCGKFIEFENPELLEIITRCSKTYGFEESSHKLVVFGLCRDCQD